MLDLAHVIGCHEVDVLLAMFRGGRNHIVAPLLAVYALLVNTAL